MKIGKILILLLIILSILSCNQPISLDQFQTEPDEGYEEENDAEIEFSEEEGEEEGNIEEGVSQENPIIVNEKDFDKLSLWMGETQLRGANIYQRIVYPELDGPDFFGPGPLGPPFQQSDFNELAALGANYVNISHAGLFTEKPPYEVNLESQANLDKLLDMVEKADMFAVISFRTGPGRSEFTFFWDEVGTWFDKSYLNDSVWQDELAQDAWSDMWQYTASRYKDSSIIVGYDLMVEPNSNEVGSHAVDDNLDMWEPEEFYDQFGETLYDWNQMFPEITEAIRQVDENTPILVGGMGYSAVNWLPYISPSKDDRTIYLVHQYAPYVYTHQEANNIRISYPDFADLDYDSQKDNFDKTWLDNALQPIDDFMEQYEAPVAINEFGPVRYVPGADQYLSDHMQLMDKRGLNYALWVWDPNWVPMLDELDYFTFRFGNDPKNHSLDPDSALTQVIQKQWKKNEIRPSMISLSHGEADDQKEDQETIHFPESSLQNITYWGYQIQNINNPDSIETLLTSSYEMLVIEPTRTDWSSHDRYFDTQGLIENIKMDYQERGINPPLMIAYIDIGEAEDWRWYWNWSQDWDCESPIPDDWPDFILSCDPDGWGGNYPVAFWEEDWKDIIIYGIKDLPSDEMEYQSTIDEVLKSGFDGIYLDWVEAFEDQSVIQAAELSGKDPAHEMVKFIEEMRDYARKRDPDFLIIQQNAASLINYAPEIIKYIDAIAQEGIWYEGIATDNWNDPDGYDLIVEKEITDQYLLDLQKYLDAGIPVFDVEYTHVYADQAFENALKYGFIPCLTRRSLGKLSESSPQD
ncbi:MAG: cellulase family glycosylhydrolase [Anaerolineaceae bacterium]|nr:cellulase family glycosylhydrolase [Anaerolineaceae bacterium]